MKFEYKAAYDFAFGLLRFSNACEHKIYGKINKVSVNRSLENLMDEFISQSSLFIIKETAYFSKLGIGNWLINALVCDDESIYSIADILDKFNQLSDEEFFNYIGGLSLTSFSYKEHKGWEKIMTSIPLMADYISNSTEINSQDKVELLDLFKYPEETRQRLKVIINGFYKIYFLKESYIEEQSLEALKVFEDQYKKDQEAFRTTYLKDKKAEIISVSYIQDRGVKSMGSLIHKDNKSWISIGCNGLDYVRNIKKEQSAQEFLKVLSDGTRLKIMTMLATEKNYVQAIASDLELAPSTIYHHLDALSKMSLVATEKVGKKVYYEVNREQVLEGMKTLSSILIGGVFDL